MKKGVVSISSLFMVMAFLCLLPLYAHAAGKKLSLQWQKGNRTVETGKKLRLKVKIQHKKRGSRLVWSSSSKKIATVSKQGVVSGKKPGKVKISVKIQGTTVKRSCEVRVVKANKGQKPSGKKTPIPRKSDVPGSKPEGSSVPSYSGNSSQSSPGTHPDIPEETGLPMVSPSVMPTFPGENPTAPTTKPDPTEEPTNPTGKPNPTEGPTNPTGKPNLTKEPTNPTGEPVLPTGSPITPTNAPIVPSASPTPIYVPDKTELIPYSAVMEVQGEAMTVYLVHKNYEGQVHVRLNGKEFTAAGNAKDALILLANGGTTKTNSAGTIRISRQTGKDGMLEEYWTVEDLEQGVSYQMKAKTRNSIYPAVANCGMIYFRGDVTAAIEIY